jgi:PAS domain S-box-containing protein
MKDGSKSRNQLIREVESLRRKVTELETALITHTDSTAREKVEDALRKSEAKYRAVVENSHDMIIFCDSQGIITYRSPLAYKTIGHTDEERLGGNILDVVHSEDLDSARRYLDQLIQNPETPLTVEYRILHKDGSWRWLEINASNLLNNPNIRQIVLLCRDMTERKKIEEGLRQSSEEWKKTFDSVPDLIAILDNQHRIIRANKALADRMGCNSEACSGLTCYENIHGTDAPPSFCPHALTLADGKEHLVEVHEERLGGDFWVSTTPVFDEQGKITTTIHVARDISESKKAETIIKETVEQLKLFVENAPAGVAMFDRDMRYMVVSRRFLSDYRISNPNIIGMSHYEVFPEIPDRWKEIHQRCISGAVARCEEDPFPREDGTIDWVCWEIRPWKTSSNEIGGIILFSELITERIKAKEEKEKAYRQRDLILTFAGEGIIGVDREGNHTFVNPAAAQMLGYTQDELIRKNSHAVWHHTRADGSPYPEEECPMYYTLKKGGAFHWGDEVLWRKDGTSFWVDYSSYPILEEGKVRGAVIIFIDITERKRMEDALRESEDQFRMLSDKSPFGMSLIDVDGRCEYVNPAFVNLFGYDLSDVPTGEDWFYKAFPDPEYRRKVVLAWKEDLQEYPSPETRFRTFKVRCHNGTFKTILIRSVTLSSGKQFILYEDISSRLQAEEEKRKLEEQLQRAEKMEALGTLAGGVAHDLNNVLGIIVGYSELVHYDLEPSSPFKPAINNILVSSQKAAAIVQDLLALARRGIADRQIVNLNQIIIEFQNSPEFKKIASSHSLLNIRMALEPDLLNVAGSPVHLSKTLFNLLLNAAEAMPYGGPLTIETFNQYLDKPIHGYDEIREGDYVVLSISDTGEGIPASDLKRIFEPFYTKKIMGRSGTGLGLAVVWGTVKDHHGYINVRSEEGRGTHFSLYFPVTREALTLQPPKISIVEFMGRGESILIVDDIQGQRNLAEDMLRKLNYNAVSVGSGEEALDYLKNKPVDLLVLDMIMDPGMDGLDTYKKILEIYPRQKAIIVSGYSESERVHTAQILGAGAYIKKPYVLEKLGLAIRKELDR